MNWQTHYLLYSLLYKSEAAGICKYAVQQSLQRYKVWQQDLSLIWNVTIRQIAFLLKGLWNSSGILDTGEIRDNEIADYLGRLGAQQSFVDSEAAIGIADVKRRNSSNYGGRKITRERVRVQKAMEKPKRLLKRNFLMQKWCNSAWRTPNSQRFWSKCTLNLTTSYKRREGLIARIVRSVGLK